jgi:hypothetical protein
VSRICCCACGTRLVVELLLPSEVWERIAAGAYALCPECIDARMAAAGIVCEAVAFFGGAAVTTPITPHIRSAVKAWRPGPMDVARGSVGNPLLYGGRLHGAHH